MNFPPWIYHDEITTKKLSHDEITHDAITYDEIPAW